MWTTSALCRVDERRLLARVLLVLAALASARTALAQGPPPVQVERITLTPRGFEPRQMSRPAARFLLALDNRTRFSVILLRIDREGGPRLREVRMPRGRMKFREFFNLPAGRYVLTEASHPNWVCTITIR